MNIKKEFSNHQTLLLITPSTDYNKNILKMMRELSSSSICYVTLNKTFDSLLEFFKKNKINTENMVFVDAISKKIKNVPEQANQVYYIPLAKLSRVISKFLRHNFKYIIFDSITNLLVYQRKKNVSKFTSSLVDKIKKSKTKIIFFALSGKKQDKLIKEIVLLVDKTVNLNIK